MGYYYLTLLTITALYAARLRRWWIAAALASWAAMAAFVTWGAADSEAWLRYRWAPAEGAAMVLTLAATWALLLEESRTETVLNRCWLLFGASCVSAAVVGLIWQAAGPRRHDPYWTFVFVRCRAWEWIAGTLALVAVMRRRLGPDPCLLLAVALAHALIGPLALRAGPSHQVIYRLAVGASCSGWILWRGYRHGAQQSAPAPRGGHPGAAG